MTSVLGVASVKGSPGVTAICLALAAAWPRPVVLLEADPAGGDLAFRCRAAHGGVVHTNRSILTLAAATRDGSATPQLLLEHSQRLSCGVDVVTGIASAAQAPGLATLWAEIGAACRASSVDVIVDLGRLDARGPVIALAHSLDTLGVVAACTLSSVVHLSEGLADLVQSTARRGGVPDVVPILIGPDESAEQDCADFDELLRGCAVSTGRAQPMPYDVTALARLEHGERSSGRLGRTLLLRRARQLASVIASDQGLVSA